MNLATLFAFAVVAILAMLAGTRIILPLSNRFRREFIIPEGFAGLLYRHGLFIRRNNAGRHVLWGSGWSLKLVDLRRRLLFIPRQEAVTADDIALKLSLVVSYQITDPAKAAHETQNWYADLNQSAQLALQTATNRSHVTALLHREPELHARLHALIKADTEKIGLTVLAAELKDVRPSSRQRTFAQTLPANPARMVALNDAVG